MSIVKEGLLTIGLRRSYIRRQVLVKLHSHAVLEIESLNTSMEWVKGLAPFSQKIELSPKVVATQEGWDGTKFSLKIANKTMVDAPIFYSANTKEVQRWINMINFIRLRATVEMMHVHPLTLGVDLSYCRVCSEEVAAYECEFCRSFNRCTDCQLFFEDFSSPFITSPHHPFQLVQCATAEDVAQFMNLGTQTAYCARCHKQCNGTVFHCVECGTYNECGMCVAEYWPKPIVVPDEMTLDPKHLSHVLRVSGNTFTLSEPLNKCPRSASMIANKCWDLSSIERAPVPHAYFEVTFTKLNSEGLASVGIGNQIFVQNQLLGYQQNTFGYLSSGEAAQNVGANVQLYSSYGQGDTVGTGVLLDTFNRRRLFFTKNGRMIGMYSAPIHKGMDCFPGVSFTKTSGVEFVVNMTGPFQFDVDSIPDYRKEKIDRFLLLPPEVWINCLAYASLSPIQTLQMRLVSKQWMINACDNQIWKPLFLKRWPMQSARLRIRSWYNMFKTRTEIGVLHRLGSFSISEPLSPQFIDNCDFEFECPLVWDSIKATPNENERFCDTCQKTVYRVTNQNTLRSYIEMGRCVSFVKPKTNHVMMGRAFLNPLVGTLGAFN